MIANPSYTPEALGTYERISIGRLELELGGVLPDAVLGVRTWGEPNAARDNAILIPTWFSGTHQSWAESFVGPGHALDPAHWFIVCVNQLGNGVSTSPHNVPDASLALSRFPRLRIGDDVAAQDRLLRERFGVDRLALVVGASMGAMQALAWASAFPDRVARVAAIAGTARRRHDRLFAAALDAAITSDPGWAGGDYSSHLDVGDGLRRHARLWAAVGFSGAFWAQDAWGTFGATSREQFLSGVLEPVFASMDPDALLVMSEKWQHAELTPDQLARITARTLVLPIDHDLLFSPADCAEDQALIPGSELRVIESIHGHLALFATDPGFVPQVDAGLHELLSVG